MKVNNQKGKNTELQKMRHTIVFEPVTSQFCFQTESFKVLQILELCHTVATFIHIVAYEVWLDVNTVIISKPCRSGNAEELQSIVTLSDWVSKSRL